MGVLGALVVILNVVDSSISISTIPGIRLGISNIVIIVTIYLLGEKEGLIILIIKVFLAGLLRGSFLSLPFYMSLGGSTISFLAMILFKRIKAISIVGISVVGSFFHIIVQIVIAMIFMETYSLIYYAPVLLSISLTSGIIIGIIGEKLVKINIFERISKR